MVDLCKVTELGKATQYHQQYNRQVLVAVPRPSNTTPHYGYDVWRCWEMSWLDPQQRPVTAALRISYPASSPCIVESKSLKLYLGSFNFTAFPDSLQLLKTIQCDLSYTVGALVKTELLTDTTRSTPHGQCIDDAKVQHVTSMPEASLLSIYSQSTAEETLYSNTFRSCCPVTAQPDWATIVLDYRGPTMCQHSLASYLFGYRNHAAFHESCITKIYTDIQQQCQPEALTITGYFTRRGGLDINPCRSSNPDIECNDLMLPRQ